MLPVEYMGDTNVESIVGFDTDEAPPSPILHIRYGGSGSKSEDDDESVGSAWDRLRPLFQSDIF